MESTEMDSMEKDSTKIETKMDSTKKDSTKIDTKMDIKV